MSYGVPCWSGVCDGYGTASFWASYTLRPGLVRPGLNDATMMSLLRGTLPFVRSTRSSPLCVQPSPAGRPPPCVQSPLGNGRRPSSHIAPPLCAPSVAKLVQRFSHLASLSLQWLVPCAPFSLPVSAPCTLQMASLTQPARCLARSGGY